jgi:hypothetical protein
MRAGSARRTPWRNGPSTALSKGALAACGSHPGRRDGGGYRPGHRRPPARRGLTVQTLFTHTFVQLWPR